MSTEANKVEGAARVGANDIRKWVLTAQVLLAAGIWWGLGQTFLLIWDAAALPKMEFFGNAHIGWFLSLALVGGALIYTLRNPVAQDFAQEVVVELRKVSWPTAKETRQSTLVVVIVVVIVALILGAFDFVWAKVIKALLEMGATGG